MQSFIVNWSLSRHVHREWALLSFHSVCLSVSHSATYSLPRWIDHNQIWSAGIYLSSDPYKPFWIPYLPYFWCQREKYAKCRLFPSERDALYHMTFIVYLSDRPYVCHKSVFIVQTQTSPKVWMTNRPQSGHSGARAHDQLLHIQTWGPRKILPQQASSKVQCHQQSHGRWSSVDCSYHTQSQMPLITLPNTHALAVATVTMG